MKPTAINRLERLERVQGGTRVTCIERVIFDADGRRVEPDAYRDALGNRWARDSGETYQEFRERIETEAVAAAGPCIARIVGEAG
jgi:hypothetical protein